MAKLHRRRHTRETSKSAAWVFDGPHQYPCVVLDVSESGMRLDLLGREPENSSFSVFFGADRPMALCHVQWRTGSVVGVRLG